jgi:hypothetical protein
MVQISTAFSLCGWRGDKGREGLCRAIEENQGIKDGAKERERERESADSLSHFRIN